MNRLASLWNLLLLEVVQANNATAFKTNLNRLSLAASSPQLPSSHFPCGYTLAALVFPCQVMLRFILSQSYSKVLT
uniref:Secreted protein n=1 Tax=Ascaris lumbricoides TaxID=6252 RepID=A0A0M3I039_ASCLU